MKAFIVLACAVAVANAGVLLSAGNSVQHRSEDVSVNDNYNNDDDRKIPLIFEVKRRTWQEAFSVVASAAIRSPC